MTLTKRLIGTSFADLRYNYFYTMGGILIHELKHEAYDLHGIPDMGFAEKYGVDEALRRARIDPGFAADNPDNYLFFAEAAHHGGEGLIPTRGIGNK